MLSPYIGLAIFIAPALASSRDLLMIHVFQATMASWDTIRRMLTSISGVVPYSFLSFVHMRSQRFAKSHFVLFVSIVFSLTFCRLEVNPLCQSSDSLEVSVKSNHSGMCAYTFVRPSCCDLLLVRPEPCYNPELVPPCPP